MINYIGYIFYWLATQCYFIFIRLVSVFNRRAHLLVSGQKNLIHKIENEFIKGNKKTAWFHCASLGEFEQGKPLMEELKLLNYQIFVTFFSSSGYLARKNDSVADAVYYLPFDSKKNAKRLIGIIKPEIVFWIKYDFWYHYLNQISKQQIPLFLVSALFRNNQLFFKPYAVFYKNILKKFNLIFCQNKQTQDLLYSTGIKNALVSGDTRFDNVIRKSANSFLDIILQNFAKNSAYTIIGGSTYSSEEQMLSFVAAELPKNSKIIIAPHFVNEQRILEIKKLFNKFSYILYSDANQQTVFTDVKILIIDKIGLLTNAYKLADIALIGGGFWEGGLHNVLEPSVYGVICCFGPKISRFPEATHLVNNNLAVVINKPDDLRNFLLKMAADKALRIQKSDKIKAYVKANEGSAKRIISYALK